MAGERHMTRDHDRIREWVEARGGWPATVASTRAGDDPGLIRIDFPGYSGSGSLERISWDQWFSKFDESDLVFLFQETLADGGQSSFNKLISGDTAEQNDSAEWDEAAVGTSRAGTVDRSNARRDMRAGGINLNRATAEELDSVFGIGPATARRIVEYRDRELGGEFHSVHDITHIPGIGDGTAELITRNASLE